MTASTRSLVSTFTKSDLLMTRDTVFFDTSAKRAMSLIVRRPRVSVSGGLDSASGSALRETFVILRAVTKPLGNRNSAHRKSTPVECHVSRHRLPDRPSRLSRLPVHQLGFRP